MTAQFVTVMETYLHNSNSHSNGTDIEDFNIVYIQHHAIVAAFMIVLSIVGSIGNISVILVYGFLRHKTTNNIFILSLAVSDCLVCSVALPLEIAEKISHYTLHSIVSCKTYRVLCYLLVLISAGIIIPISVDRYRRVCLPLRKQISPNMAVVILGCMVVIAMLASAPNAFIWSLQRIAFANNVTGNQCVIDIYYDKPILSFLYNTSLLVFSTFAVLILSVLYTLIGCRVLSHIKFRRRFRKKAARCKIINTVGGNENTITESTIGKRIAISESKDSPRKVTKIAFIIVVVFVLSYIPTCIVKLFDTLWMFHQFQYDSANEHVLILLARISYLINDVANCFIYAFFDPHFRVDVKKVVCIHIRK